MSEQENEELNVKEVVVDEKPVPEFEEVSGRQTFRNVTKVADIGHEGIMCVTLEIDIEGDGTFSTEDYILYDTDKSDNAVTVRNLADEWLLKAENDITPFVPDYVEMKQVALAKMYELAESYRDRFIAPAPGKQASRERKSVLTKEVLAAGELAEPTVQMQSVFGPQAIKHGMTVYQYVSQLVQPLIFVADAAIGQIDRAEEDAEDVIKALAENETLPQALVFVEQTFKAEAEARFAALQQSLGAG